MAKDETITTRLNVTLLHAGSANCRKLFRIPEPSAVKPRNRIQGKMIRFRYPARSQWTWLTPIKVKIPMTCLENTHPRMDNTAKTTAASQNVRWAKAQVSRCDLARRYPEKTGKKDAPTPPPPEMRRIILGIRKAKINESATGEVPSSRATL